MWRHSFHPQRDNWAFSIYKKKFGKFPLRISVWEKRVPFVTSSFRGRPGRLKARERCGTVAKDEKSVNGAQISIGKFPPGKRDLPFQKFSLFRTISSGTNRKVVLHLHPNRNFRKFLVNGKRQLPAHYVQKLKNSI